ncbi:purple acid phosphatase family protein [Paludisphaera rhizosphaerae]|uniref:purple acid phosphatase family protein n=1 Tax=Paludisphaera rhizosphaerae TaxID=2711216 RepID=UPI001F0F03F8|nr:metallophosphoesterase family protein [Paludisphaera rhizosphaerae]
MAHRQVKVPTAPTRSNSEALILMLFLPRAFALAALFGVMPVAAAHDEHEPKAVPDAEAHRPSALPDRIILTFPGDPSRSLAVTWRTDDAVSKGLAQIAPSDAGPRFAERAATLTAKTFDLDTDLGHSHRHSVVFGDLAPSTQYAYRVGDGVNWSEWFHVQTASDKPEPFAFIYFGDAQNDIKSLWSRVIRGAYSDAPKARFIVHAGDLVNRANRDAAWGEWFAAGGWVNGMVPSVPAPGNHEYERPAGAAADSPPLLSNHWRPQFTLPTNGPAGLEESAYYFDYQGARIVVLNSNEKQEDQVAWLERILADNPNKWTIATFHHPIYSSAKKRDNPKLRALWQPVFDKHRVDLVLQGHDHTYARSGLRAYENVPEGVGSREDGGTVYVVSVSGPKMYELQRDDWMKRAAEDTQLYQIISVNGDRLRYEALTAVGDLYDAFDLRKRPSQPNELIDRTPKDLPERLRPRPAEKVGAGD